MEFTTSSDGTKIAFSSSGSGPELVLVHGSTADHTRWHSVLAAFEKAFTVVSMDRRGRGQSGDAEDYEIEREYDDVAAVMGVGGNEVSLLGHSFGAICALEAALRADNLKRLVLYEPAFPVGDVLLYPPGLSDRMMALLRSGNRDGMVTTMFKEAAGLTDDQVDTLRADASWAARITSAHTALREMVAEENYRFEPDRFGSLNVPVMLLVGETSPEELKAPSMALHAALPNSEVVTLEGQGHVAMTTAPELFASTVLEFLSDGSAGKR